MSVTSAVKLFVITRLNSMCSRPSVPWTRCGVPVVVTCNAVVCDAADASVRAAEAGTAPRAIAETRASAKVIRRRGGEGLVLTVLQSAGQDEAGFGEGPARRNRDAVRAPLIHCRTSSTAQPTPIAARPPGAGAGDDQFPRPRSGGPHHVDRCDLAA